MRAFICTFAAVTLLVSTLVGCKGITVTSVKSGLNDDDDSSTPVIVDTSYCATNHPSAYYCEDFEGIANGAAWPSEWAVPPEVGALMMAADVQNERGRLRAADANGSFTAVARIVSQTLSLQNVDVYYTIEYENYAQQGIGFYGRQNGGWFAATNPDGLGYALFIEGNGTPRMSLWYENGAGSEIEYSGGRRCGSKRIDWNYE